MNSFKSISIENQISRHVDRSRYYGKGLTDRLQTVCDVDIEKIFGQLRGDVKEKVRQFGTYNKNLSIMLCGPRGFMKMAKQVFENEGCDKVFYQLHQTGVETL